MSAQSNPGYTPEPTPEPSFTPTGKQQGLWNVIASAPPGSRSLIGYGGAAGGGKTRGLVELGYDLGLEFPGNKILIARKDFSDLRGTTMEQFDMNADPAIITARNNSENWRHIRRKNWPPGIVSKIIFRELKDYLGLGSEEYGAVLIDEAGEVAENSALMLLSRLRWKLPAQIRNKGFQIKYAFVAASNPYPGWFKRWFVDRELPEEALADFDAKITFIPALARDNPYLDPNYENFLRTIYPADWVRRLMDGSWDVFIGQVYPSFSPAIHEWRFTDPVTGEPHIPKFKRLIGGLDFGEPSNTAHKSAGIVAGVMDSGRILRLDEFEENGPDVTLRQVEWMARMEDKWLPYVKANRFADEHPRILWSADKTQMAAIGVLRPVFAIRPTKGGPNSVQWGIRLVSDRLYTNPSVRLPGSFYLPHLSKFRDGMERYRWPERDDQKPAPTTPLKVDDDLVDADRYMHELVANVAIDPMAYRNQLPRYQNDPIPDAFTRNDNPWQDFINGLSEDF